MLLKELTDASMRIMVVGPHPDDIEFSTGRLILRRSAKNVYAVCMSDGRKGQEGTPGRIIPEEDYSRLRTAESLRALSELGIYEPIFLGLPDQDIVSNPYVIDRLYMLMRKISPDLILIPPWEGAHPDHDATHLFCLIAARNYGRARLVEYSSYNNYKGDFRVQEFIPKETKIFSLKPTPREQKRWLSVMRTFKSQKNQQAFYIPKSVDEKFRPLPRYDYHRLPYAGKQGRLIRSLLSGVYPIARHLIPKDEKLFYETWTSINPEEVKGKLNDYVEHYSVR